MLCSVLQVNLSFSSENHMIQSLVSLVFHLHDKSEVCYWQS